MKKILVIGFPFSIHTVRWLSNIDRSIFEVHFFSSVKYADWHKDLQTVIIHEDFCDLGQHHRKAVRRAIFLPFLPSLSALWYSKIIRLGKRLLWGNLSRVNELVKVVQQVKPDLIHTLETQHAGYLLAKAKPLLGSFNNRWMHTTWGIDLHYFTQLADQQVLLQEVFRQVEFLIVEGTRDLQLAKAVGFKGEYTILPNVGGGFNFLHREFPPPSLRRSLLVKGNQDEIRRALFALLALRKIHLDLQGYKIIIVNPAPEVLVEGYQLIRQLGLDVTFVKDIDYEEIITLTGNARLSVTINLSDGLPSSMLEAMGVGCFPIQSDTAIDDGWIEQGKNGFRVSPYDTDQLSTYIQRALQDDWLVDNAAQINRAKVKAQLEYATVRQQINALYSR